MRRRGTHPSYFHLLRPERKRLGIRAIRQPIRPAQLLIGDTGHPPHTLAVDRRVVNDGVRTGTALRNGAARCPDHASMHDVPSAGHAPYALAVHRDVPHHRVRARAAVHDGRSICCCSPACGRREEERKRDD